MIAYKLIRKICIEFESTALSKKDRISLIKSYRKISNEEVEIFLNAYNDFIVTKDQLVAGYTRHIKIDSYGQKDLRKVQQHIVKLLVNEGVRFQSGLGWQAEWEYGDDLKYILMLIELYLENKSTDNLSAYDRGIKYEDDCKMALEKISANVSRTSAGADYGADLVFEYKEKKFVVQCKNLNKKAGVKSIQEVVAAVKHYQSDGSIVFSNSGFSDAAEKLATTNKVMLFSGTNTSTLDLQYNNFFVRKV